MSKSWRRLLVLCAFVGGGVSGSSAAQSPTPPAFRTLTLAGQASPAAKIDAMAWLAGRWTGEGLGGTCEELWSPPRAGSMMGAFRQYRADGTLLFYEFMTLVEENGSLALKLKHFNPDLTGWEEKDGFVTFRLVKVEATAVHFNGLSFLRQPDGSLRIVLRLRAKQEVREEEFRLRRAE